MYPLGEAVTVAELTADPHPVLARLRAAEPVSWLPALDGWLVTGYELGLRVMRDARSFTVDDPRFSTAVVVGPSMLSLDGPEHGRHRDPFARDFRPAEIVARFGDFVDREAGRLVGALRPAGRAELRRGLAGPLSVAVVAEALGLDRSATGQVLAWYDAIVSSVAGISAGQPPAPAGTAAFDQLRTRIEDTVGRRAPSLLTQVADRLDLPAVVSNAAVLMFGGIETTEGMITNAVLHLLSHPEQAALLAAEPDLLPAAVEESLRLEPAAATVDRYATRDLELGGAQLRRGDLVTVSITGANRDPSVFARPDVFDIRRENSRRHLAFAHGPHFCLGVELARLETRAALRQLLDQLPGLRLVAPAEPTGLVFRKPEAVWVEWPVGQGVPRS
ncbi:MAG TPA: cytochrome P450 [Pseudonocardia sp.]|nr:cytochrome P450 [Pseudonocardia sp.]